EISRPSILTANAQTGSEREVITPERYAQAYRLARTAIHALPGHEHDQVLIAPPAPWNNQTTYLGNPNGDWVQYFSDILDELGPGNVDGITLHTYTHSGDPKAIRSESRLDPPFENRYFEFRTYRDFMNAIPAAMRALPVYITETNQDVPWVDNVSGWVQLAYAEINEWNSQPGNQKIHALVLYRWPTIDKWGIEGKQGVIDDFRLALQADYRWTDPLPSTETPPVAGLVQIGPNSIEPTITDSLVFQVTAFNPTIGTNDGDGIDNVQMQIVGPDGEIVYEKQENTPGYCAFGGGEPDCSTLVFSNNDNRWPDGQPVQGGLHTLRAVVNASRSVSQTLESTIRIQLPQQTVASFSGSCTDVATNLSDALSQCSDLNVGWACYAAAEVETSPIEFKFAQVGDRRPLSVLSSIGTLGGIAVINAQLAGEAEPVKLIAFGDTQIDAGHLVMLRTFDGELICEPAPPGLVILTDDSSAKSVIAVNGVELLVDGSDGDASLQQFVTLTPSSPVTTTGVDIRLDGTVAPVQQATTQAPSCRVVVNALNLRSGPGTVYVPPIGTLILDQMLIPIGRDGEAKWLQVNVGGAGQVGWVAADPNFIACNLDRSLLPIVSAPPTPMPTPISIPIQELTVGDRATVLIEANLRHTPGYFAKPDDDILTVIPANEVVTIIGGPSVDDQPTRAIAPFPSIWWRVSYEDASGTFLEGWLPIESIDFQPVLQQLDPARN
ncbi:MAG: SH3 domain-containing protein, partial [Caldilineaceae bacterium]|nr:SH3 domain-containing protein [Caldilineaceae bacterium]